MYSFVQQTHWTTCFAFCFVIKASLMLRLLLLLLFLQRCFQPAVQRSKGINEPWFCYSKIRALYILYHFRMLFQKTLLSLKSCGEIPVVLSSFVCVFVHLLHQLSGKVLTSTTYWVWGFKAHRATIMLQHEVRKTLTAVCFIQGKQWLMLMCERQCKTHRWLD